MEPNYAYLDVLLNGFLVAATQMAEGIASNPLPWLAIAGMMLCLGLIKIVSGRPRRQRF